MAVANLPKCPRCERQALPYGKVWHCPGCGKQWERTVAAHTGPGHVAGEHPQSVDSHLINVLWIECKDCKMRFLWWRNDTGKDWPKICPCCSTSISFKLVAAYEGWLRRNQ